MRLRASVITRHRDSHRPRTVRERAQSHRVSTSCTMLDADTPHTHAYTSLTHALPPHVTARVIGHCGAGRSSLMQDHVRFHRQSDRQSDSMRCGLRALPSRVQVPHSIQQPTRPQGSSLTHVIHTSMLACVPRRTPTAGWSVPPPAQIGLVSTPTLELVPKGHILHPWLCRLAAVGRRQAPALPHAERG